MTGRLIEKRYNSEFFKQTTDIIENYWKKYPQPVFNNDIASQSLSQKHDTYLVLKELCYLELDLESLQRRGNYRNLFCYFKIEKSRSLLKLISWLNRSYRIKSFNKISHFQVTKKVFENSFSFILYWRRMNSTAEGPLDLDTGQICTLKFFLASFLRLKKW